MNILIIDAQGGGIGKQLVTAVRENMPDAVITAVGTNAAATSAMLKAGAVRAATGENAVIVNSAKADVIIGPIGIVIARSNAKRILIPVSHCDNIVAGVGDLNTGKLIQAAVCELLRL